MQSEAQRSWGFLAFALLLTAALFWCQQSHKIGYAPDAVVFTPPILELSKSGELKNPDWRYAPALNPDGEPYFTTHGLLFPVVTARFFQPKSYRELSRILAGYRAASLVLLTALIVRWSSSRPGFFHFACFASALSFLSYSGLGRPEGFTGVLVLGSTAILAEIWSKPLATAIVASVGIGLIGSAHPLTGVICGLLYAAFALRSGRSLWSIFATALGAATLFFLLFLWYPISLERWWFGFSQAATVAVNVGADLGDLAPGRIVGLGFVLLALSVGRVAFDWRKDRFAAALFIAAVFILFWFSSWKPRTYNYVALTGLISLGGALWLPALKSVAGRKLSAALAGGLGTVGLALTTCLALSFFAAPDVESKVLAALDTHEIESWSTDARAVPFTPPGLVRSRDKNNRGGTWLLRAAPDQCGLSEGDQVLYTSLPRPDYKVLTKLYTGHHATLVRYAERRRGE